MTLKEIRKFLDNTKVYVNGKSKEIQEKLFSLGYKWINGDTDVCCTEDPFLFIYKDMSFTRSSDMNCFSQHNNREITAKEILSLEVTEPTYRPFKTKDECWDEMLKHKPFGWIYHKVCNCYAPIRVDIEDNTGFKSFFNLYTFADGTPFGILEN